MNRHQQYIIVILITHTLFACTSTTKESETRSQNVVQEKKADPVIDSVTISRNQIDKIQVNAQDSNHNSDLQSYISSKNWSALEQWGYTKLQDNPKDIRALNVLGLVSYYKKKPMAAKFYFSKALELSPGNGAILNNMGLISQLEGNEREAILNWRQASQAKSSPSDQAQSNLVTAFVKGKDYRKVMGIADRIDYHKSNNVSLLVNLGIAYMANNQLDKAEKLFSRAVELEDSNKVALINYAILNIEHNQNLDLGRRQLDQLSFLGVESDMQVTVNRLQSKLENAKSK